MQGAEILFYPTAIGWHPSEKKQYGDAQHDAWEVIQRSHAVANGCYVCVPNRIGHELVRGHQRQAGEQGRHRVLGPVVHRRARRPGRERAAPVDKEAVMVRTATSRSVEFSRTHWPFLRDRRIDAYGDLTKRFSD